MLVLFDDEYPILFLSEKLSLHQVPKVLDQEVSKEAQCEGLASCDCIEQGSQCLWT